MHPVELEVKVVDIFRLVRVAFGREGSRQAEVNSGAVDDIFLKMKSVDSIIAI